MDRKQKKYLWDIIEHLGDISSFLTGIQDLDSFKRNKLVQSAVEREFEIIGEAVKNLKIHYPDFVLSNAEEIIGLRNIIAHGYDIVDHDILWKIIQVDLPLLKSEVNNFLEKEGNGN